MKLLGAGASGMVHTSRRLRSESSQPCDFTCSSSEAPTPDRLNTGSLQRQLSTPLAVQRVTLLGYFGTRRTAASRIK
jgi:hypothetical protein